LGIIELLGTNPDTRDSVAAKKPEIVRAARLQHIHRILYPVLEQLNTVTTAIIFVTVERFVVEKASG
jgi:hypothetical protein